MKYKYLVLLFLIPSSLTFAQGTDTSADTQQTQLEGKIHSFDNLLNVVITTSLTGLSLTGATFLMRVIKNEEGDIRAIQISKAKKSLIRAFILFLACTVFIFVFDFIEILYSSTLSVLILDLIISYSLFFTGLAYLTFAAKEIYVTQAK